MPPPCHPTAGWRQPFCINSAWCWQGLARKEGPAPGSPLTCPVASALLWDCLRPPHWSERLPLQLEFLKLSLPVDSLHTHHTPQLPGDGGCTSPSPSHSRRRRESAHACTGAQASRKACSRSGGATVVTGVMGTAFAERFNPVEWPLSPGLVLCSSWHPREVRGPHIGTQL